MTGILKPGEQAVFIGDSYDDVDAWVMNKISAIAALYGYGRKNIDKYIPIQKRFIDEHKPDESCDIYIDNSNYDNPRMRR